MIKEVRGITSLGLKEAKELVDNALKPILEGASKEDAEKAKEAPSAGGTVELQQFPRSSGTPVCSLNEIPPALGAGAFLPVGGVATPPHRCGCERHPLRPHLPPQCLAGRRRTRCDLAWWRAGINVFVSDDLIDAGTDVRALMAPTRSRCRREQTYVHFDPEHGFTVVGERLLAMDGVMNFRDLGGYPTIDGGATRWGQVFRSARLNGTSDTDLERIERSGITKVFDLRTQAEVDNELIVCPTVSSMSICRCRRASPCRRG